jgi:hypothetical protein
MVIAPVVVGVLCALAVVGVWLRRTARTLTGNSQPSGIELNAVPDVVSGSDMLLESNGNSHLYLTVV